LAIGQQASSELVVVACLYTLRVAALVGSQFDTQILKGSGLCPKQYVISTLSSVALTSILDILETHDFIEIIDVFGDDRVCRFNHHFLAATLCQMMPFISFRAKVHDALSEYYRRHHPTKDEDSDFIYSAFEKQLLLRQKALYVDNLPDSSKEALLKKRIELKLDEAKFKPRNVTEVIILDKVKSKSILCSLLPDN
jgi:hypothetical protein